MNDLVKIEDIYVNVNGKELTYRNNPNIRQAGTQLQYKQEHIGEFVKCKRNIIYFAENYAYITDPNIGLTKIKLYSFQKKILKQYVDNRFNINMQSRQTGKSTLAAIFLVWYILFHKDKSCAIIANKLATSREIFGRSMTTFENIPQFLKPGVISFNKSTLHLDNGSKIISASGSSGSIRGQTINVLYIDEIAFISDFINFWKSTYPVISSINGDKSHGKNKDGSYKNASKIIMTSTPNGFNHFKQLWDDAVSGRSLFKPFKVIWNQVPGRNKKWKEETIKNTSVEAFMQEQECIFASASNSLITSEVMLKIDHNQPISTSYNGMLKVYEEPEANAEYIIAVDISEGVGQDSSTMSVIKVSSEPMEQVAVFKDNMLEQTLFPRLIKEVGMKYNEALLLVESNTGFYVLEQLMNEEEYENIFNEEKRLGVRTTKKTKMIGCSRFKELMENNGLLVNDFETFKEMSNFVFKGNSYSASSGNHDDLVMGLVIFAYFTTTDYFKELKNDYKFMDKILKKRRKEIIDSEMEIGFIHVDGNDTTDMDEPESEYSF
jgi:Terminase large subunit, T4likevirus-type, N-terminal/Terminase RNaseH-like domain